MPITVIQHFRFDTNVRPCSINCSVVAAPVGVSNAANVNGDEGTTGWAFTYRQLPGNC